MMETKLETLFEVILNLRMDTDRTFLGGGRGNIVHDVSASA